MDFPHDSNRPTGSHDTHHPEHSQYQSAHSFTNFPNPVHEIPPPQHTDDPQFDIFEWYPKYQSCQRYFTEHAQHSNPVQAVAAFVNISLPFHRAQNQTSNSSFSRLSPSNHNHGPPLPSPNNFNSAFPSHSPLSSNHRSNNHDYVSLIPYIRRLVVTGLDFPGVLHGFFGNDWISGIGPQHEQERRNYLFAAKSEGWASVKKDYDMLPLETVPFLRPLQAPVDEEILAAEKSWSEWLAMEDWMVGSRAPESMGQASEGNSTAGRGRGGPR